MSRDNWERLVAAVVKREQIWQLCHDHSRSPSITSISSDSSELIPNFSGTIMELNSVSPPPQGTLSKSSLIGGQKTMASIDVPNLTHPPSGLKFWRKAEIRKQSKLWPWEAFWKRPNPSKGNGLLSSKDSAVRAPDSGNSQGGKSSAQGITIDKSIEFSYDELANATSDFSIANKISEGGYASVYYAEVRGEKTAIKKMDFQASYEFLAELKVLTHVRHLNLVHLIGYCVEGSLFLVYEYAENGNLSQHLRGSGRKPLPWSTRIQVALDVARGLEYIHEHTVPAYIHRDIKPSNILIDRNFHGKVADFGLTILDSSLPPPRIVGTFGYMPPEYAQYGDVSPKVDVYAYGVVIYEIISAKEAIVNQNGFAADSRDLVGMFEDVLNKPDPSEDLKKMVDPRLGDDYPLDSILKVAQLARACTHENPQLRPSMRSVVVALMTLSSSSDSWDVGAFYGNEGVLNSMSER